VFINNKSELIDTVGAKNTKSSNLISHLREQF